MSSFCGITPDLAAFFLSTPSTPNRVTARKPFAERYSCALKCVWHIHYFIINNTIKFITFNQNDCGFCFSQTCCWAKAGSRTKDAGGLRVLDEEWMRNAKPTLSEETTCGRWILRPPIRKFQCLNFLFKTKGVSCFVSVSILAVERLANVCKGTNITLHVCKTMQFDSWGSLVFWFFCFSSNLSCFLLEAMSWKQLSPNFETGGRPSKRQGHSAIYHPESHSMVIFGGRSLNSLLTLRLFPTACTEPRYS